MLQVTEVIQMSYSEINYSDALGERSTLDNLSERNYSDALGERNYSDALGQRCYLDNLGGRGYPYAITGVRSYSTVTSYGARKYSVLVTFY